MTQERAGVPGHDRLERAILSVAHHVDQPRVLLVAEEGHSGETGGLEKSSRSHRRGTARLLSAEEASNMITPVYALDGSGVSPHPVLL